MGLRPGSCFHQEQRGWDGVCFSFSSFFCKHHFISHTVKRVSSESVPLSNKRQLENQNPHKTKKAGVPQGAQCGFWE